MSRVCGVSCTPEEVLGEWVFIVLLLFGAKRLPEIGSSLGKGIRSFKDGITEAGTKKDVLPDKEE